MSHLPRMFRWHRLFSCHSAVVKKKAGANDDSPLTVYSAVDKGRTVTRPTARSSFPRLTAAGPDPTASISRTALPGMISSGTASARHTAHGRAHDHDRVHRTGEAGTAAVAAARTAAAVAVAAAAEQAALAPLAERHAELSCRARRGQAKRRGNRGSNRSQLPDALT